MNKVHSVGSVTNLGGGSSDVGKSLKQDLVKRLLQKVKRLIDQEFIEEAKRTLEVLGETYRKDSIGLSLGYEIAECYYRVEEYAKCITCIELIKPIEDRKVSKVQNLKGLCYLKLGDVEHAIQLFEIVIIVDPNFVSALNNLGNISMGRKEYEKCKLFYNKSKLRKILLIKILSD